MIVIICAKYKKNPSRTVDATERKRFSKSRPNDLEGIGQVQGSSHATHSLMPLIICTKYGKNPSWTVDGTRRIRTTNGHTDGQTERQTGWIKKNPNFVAGGIKRTNHSMNQWWLSFFTHILVGRPRWVKRVHFRCDEFHFMIVKHAKLVAYI